jgi:hypothetical protein
MLSLVRVQWCGNARHLSVFVPATLLVLSACEFAASGEHAVVHRQLNIEEAGAEEMTGALIPERGEERRGAGGRNAL